jgi:hypothetical protein
MQQWIKHADFDVEKLRRVLDPSGEFVFRDVSHRCSKRRHLSWTAVFGVNLTVPLVPLLPPSADWLQCAYLPFVKMVAFNSRDRHKKAVEAFPPRPPSFQVVSSASVGFDFQIR